MGRVRRRATEGVGSKGSVRGKKRCGSCWLERQFEIVGLKGKVRWCGRQRNCDMVWFEMDCEMVWI